MEKALKAIEKHNLLQKNEVVGVAVSGGADSMCLLHFLNSNKSKYKIEVVAINIDHNLRPTSEKDSEFVKNYCKTNGIKCYQFSLDVKSIIKNQKLTMEEAARIARYRMFDSLLNRNIVNKIALGHHSSDQAETVLLNIFRGTGLLGASGINFARDKYIRPLLSTPKKEILAYCKTNNIEFVNDETNFDSEANRNFIRNEILPLIQKRWPQVENNINSFANICREDDDYIKHSMPFDGVIKDKNLVKIPLTYFIYHNSVVTRLILSCFEYLKVSKDMEKKHLDIIKKLAFEGENGSKVNLPNHTTCHKEYDFLTIETKPIIVDNSNWKLKYGKLDIDNAGIITVKKLSKELMDDDEYLKIDKNKLPKDAVWRYRRNGDMFSKFGTGSKKLKSVLSSMKIPQRLRDSIPMLANDDEVFVMAGIEISEKVKIDDTTKSGYAIGFKSANK